MWKYVLRRVAWMVPLLLGISLLVFLLTQLVPGDIVAYYLDVGYTEADYLQLQRELGLDQPLYIQYFNFLGKAIQGDFGVSYESLEPVLPTVLERFPRTLLLTTAAVGFALVISIPLGVLAAFKRNTKTDYGSMFIALIGISMPNFWLGLMLILLFSLALGWFPTHGMGTPAHLVLPMVTLGIALAASNTRLTRSSMLEVLNKDYVRTAKAKGCTIRSILLKHSLRNALLPVTTNIGLQYAQFMGGALIIEIVFAWPGLGMLTYDAILQKDYNMLQGCILFLALAILIINLIVDLLYTIIDPRIRYE